MVLSGVIHGRLECGVATGTGETVSFLRHPVPRTAKSARSRIAGRVPRARTAFVVFVFFAGGFIEPIIASTAETP